MTQAALVTGASSGIGLETALALAGGGYVTYASLRDPAKEYVIHEAAAKRGVRVRVVPMDVTVQDSVDSAVRHVLQENGRLDALVNSAGYLSLGSLEDLTMDDVKRQMETNFFGAVRVTKAVLPSMRQTGGRIINVSSIGGLVGFPLSSAYVASKFALEGLTESLRYELKKFNVHVSAVEPGLVRTGLYENMRASAPEGSPYQTGALRRQAGALGERGADPRLVAETITSILREDRPSLRYSVGEDSDMILREKAGRTQPEFEEYIEKTFSEVLGFTDRDPA